MKYLLDTHVALWALSDINLDLKTKKLILNSENTIYYSSISAWEIEIKHLKYPDRFSLDSRQFTSLCTFSSYENLVLNDRHISFLEEASAVLKHKDPFDVMLLSQAIAENMILITHDKKFKDIRNRHILSI